MITFRQRPYGFSRRMSPQREGLKIGEINALCSAGVYGANVGKPVAAIGTIEFGAAFTVPEA